MQPFTHAHKLQCRMHTHIHGEATQYRHSHTHTRTGDSFGALLAWGSEIIQAWNTETQAHAVCVCRLVDDIDCLFAGLMLYFFAQPERAQCISVCKCVHIL